MKKIILLLAVTVTGSLLAAPPAGPQTSSYKEPRKQRPGGARRLQPHLWRAFSELSDQERKEIFQLQRNDPEKFREVMRKKAEEIMKAEQLERKKLMTFAKLYQNAKTDKEKAVIEKQTSEILKKRFSKRLTANRRHLEGMKRRAAMLEKELDKKAANADKIVALQTQAILSGKFTFAPRGQQKKAEMQPKKTLPEK